MISFCYGSGFNYLATTFIKRSGVLKTDRPNSRPIPVNGFLLICRVVTPTTLHWKVKFIISTVHKLNIAHGTVNTSELKSNTRIKAV